MGIFDPEPDKAGDQLSSALTPDADQSTLVDEAQSVGLELCDDQLAAVLSPISMETLASFEQMLDHLVVETDLFGVPAVDFDSGSQN
jgi:hypothetical protein